MNGEVQVTKAGEKLFNAEPVNFLYKVIVDELVDPTGEVFAFGITTMISAAGDLVIQNSVGQRVFGAAAGLWFGLFIVDQETLKPVPEFFPHAN